MSAAAAEVVHDVKSETMILGRPRKASCGFRFPRGTKATTATVTCAKCLKRMRRRKS
jgi:hypothetical protein